MGRTDLNSHGNDLTGGVGEDLTGVRERNTLALPHAAVRVGAVEVLQSALDISVVIGRLLVVNLVTAGGLETITGQTGLGRADIAVGGDSREGLSVDNLLVVSSVKSVGSECEGSLASIQRMILNEWVTKERM